MNEEKSNTGCGGCGIFLLVLFVVGIIGMASDSAPKKETSTPVETPPQVEEKIQYDILQQFFLAIRNDVTPEMIEKVIADCNLKYTRRSWNGSHFTIKYRIAYNKDAALQVRGASGDYLDVVFDEQNRIFEYAEYSREGAFAEAYYFAVPFVDNGITYTGYVYHDYQVKKIGKNQISYSNYYQYSNGEKCLQAVLRNKQ